MVRATVDNQHGAFKPEMFAHARIITSEVEAVVAVPLDAIIYEGNNARVWVAREEKSAELRRIKPFILAMSAANAFTSLFDAFDSACLAALMSITPAV